MPSPTVMKVEIEVEGAVYFKDSTAANYLPEVLMALNCRVLVCSSLKEDTEFCLVVRLLCNGCLDADNNYDALEHICSLCQVKKKEVSKVLNDSKKYYIRSIASALQRGYPSTISSLHVGKIRSLHTTYLF